MIDFADIAIPFRMQPGLRKLAPGARQLTPLRPGGALHAEKLAVWQAGRSRLSVPDFDPGPALHAIAHHMPFEGPVELAFEEDFAVLDGETGTLQWLCVCVPSHWAPEEKIGLPLAAVHAPVADNAMLLAASSQLARLVTSGEGYERFVWTITPSSRYDQHPTRQPRVPWPADESLAESSFLRAERQTFLPVTGMRQAVFTIHVMLQPLPEAVDTPEKARRLHDSIESMTPAVLDYKSLAPAREPLLRWLAKQAA